MSSIVYLSCPRCKNRFYIMAEFAGMGHTWCCPKCSLMFTEKESVEGEREKRP